MWGECFSGTWRRLGERTASTMASADARVCARVREAEQGLWRIGGSSGVVKVCWSLVVEGFVGVSIS